MAVSFDTIAETTGSIPTDRYIVRVTEVKNAPSSKGDPMASLNYEVLSPDEITVGSRVVKTAGRKGSVFIVANDKTRSRVKAAIKAWGIAPPAGDFADTRDLDKAMIAAICEATKDMAFVAMLESEVEYYKETVSDEDIAAGVDPRKGKDKLDDHGNPIIKGYRLRLETSGIQSPLRHPSEFAAA